MSKLYKLMTVLSCLLLLALFTPLSTTYAQTCTDVDGDGYGLNGDATCPNLGVDCDDTDATTYPDAPLLCDAKDNNCDGWIDFATDKDGDGDGVTLCTHWQTGLRDCDDNNPDRYPGNLEGPYGDATCADGIDNDCDNKADSSDLGCAPDCVDSDGDGYGEFGDPSCPNAGVDCDEDNAAINPGAADDNCDTVDDNCSGTPDDEYVDTPTNCGVGACASTGTLSCSGGVESDSCVEGTPAKEGALGHPTCTDTVDNDCDGATDASDIGCQGTCLDDDGDGYGFYGDVTCPNGSAIDCDDDNININPGAADDVCDGVDANCSGTADDEYTPTVTNCGVGECATTGLLICTAGATVDNCSPLAPGVEGPFGDPTCTDTLDNDCDGLIDQVPGIEDPECNPLDVDNDGDGFCEVGPCQNPANLTGDCDDMDAVTYPGAPQLCDAIDNDCDGWQDFYTDKDVDGDGVTLCTHWQTGLKDCDDNNPDRYPGNIEGPFGDATCIDAIDNDCDNKTDGADTGCSINCSDNDGDGYGSPGNVTCPNGNALDCSDGDAAINPGESDANCDGVDNNCSGTPDDEYVDTPTNCGVGACASTGTLSCSAGEESDSCTAGTPVIEGPLGDGTCSDTSDNDCDGTTDALDTGCQSLCLDDDGDGYGLYGHASCTGTGVDCNDSNNLINPGAADDNCDNVDDNCSGTPDDEYTPTVTNCGVGECATTGFMNCNAGVLEDDCTALAPGSEGPFGDPTCGDTLDNDCDGDTDTGDNDCNPLDQDNDGDGFCEVGPCQNPANLTGDCDDTDVFTYPGAPRVCDAVDNDCDGWQDFYTDKDVDGDGVTLCTHWQTGLKDCDDNNSDRYPGNVEGPFGDPTCFDGIDNDCNNKIDDQDLKCLDQCNDSDGDGYGSPGHPSCTFPEEDCNDSNININPGAADTVCDGVDDNCSGTADDEYVDTPTNCGVGACASTGTLTCSGGAEVDDCTPGLPAKEGALGHPTCTDIVDNDCDTLTDASDPGCQSSCLDDDGDGYGHYGDASCPNGPVVDCDDDNININPGAADDNCDNVDDNCSGTADDEYTPTVTNCGQGECVTTGFMNCNAGVLEDDCTPLPAGVEDYLTPLVCTDTLDNDCDGFTDTLDVGCNPPDVDNDGDGFCEVGPCQNPANLTGDCDDTDDIVHPGGNTTICDAKDTNCDGWLDFFTDKDEDGDGVPLCTHWQTGMKDCDDNDPTRYPGNQEGPRDDPTCFDGFDNDCDNKTDNLDTDCAPPTCGTDPSPQDGLHMFDLLDGNDNVLKTPCQWCHFNDAGTVDERTKCERCHADPAWGGPDDGTLKVLYTDPPPYGFGTATNVRVHSSTVLGTKYGAWDMDCLTCHNPHRQEQDNVYGTSYGKLIKEFICFDNTAIGGGNFEEIVEFTAATGPGSFADGPPHNENICEICHTQTQFHLNDGSTVEHHDGPTGDPCTTCHPHGDGFAPTGGAADAPHNNTANPGIFPNCAVCHVTETDFTTPVPSANCLNCHDEGAPLKAGGGSDIKVRSHFIGTMECIECHNPMFAQINFRGNPNLSHIRTTVNGNEIAFEAKTGPFSFADDTNAAANGMLTENYICNTCHIDQTTNHHQADGTAPGGQSHNDGLDCTGCHTHQGGVVVPDAFRDHIENSQAHDPHNNTINPGLFDQCAVCHVTESDYVTPVPSAKCLTCHGQGGIATEADTHAPAGSECIDCHNPMRAQGANASHIRTSLAVFTGGAGSFVNGSNNGICQTCHTSTEHHQNDGTAPSGQNHNDATVCTTCHTHPGTGAANDGFRDHEGTVTLPGTHNGQACDTCHDSGSYVDGFAIPNAKCTTCHDGVTAVEADAHFAAGQGSTCVECHNPMNDQAPNVKHVRTSLAVFTGGAGSFVNGSNNGICQTCHTATEHHQNDGTAPSGQNHNDAAVCTTCHTHAGTGAANDGFRDHEGTVTLPGTHNGQACDTCHDSGSYVDGFAIPNAKCTTCHDGVTAVEADAHFAAGQGSTCVECHNPMNDQSPNVKHVRTSLAVFTGGAGSFVNGSNNGICQTCHTATEHHQNDGTAPSGQNHNDATVCTTCHTHPGTAAADDGFRDHEGTQPPLPGSHAGQACDSCHDSGTYVTGAAIANGKCKNCHDGVTAVDADAHFAAGLGSTCVECHNPMSDQGANASHIRTSLAVFTGGAGSFVNGSNNGICQTCHTSTEHHQNDGTAPSGQNHNDATVCTTCHTHPGTGAANDGFRDHEGTVTLPGTHNGQACDTCHDSGSYVDGFAIPNAKCTTCHDGVTAVEAALHFGAGLGSTCVECHNPMNDQAPNVKHVRTSLAVFTGGAGSFVNGSNNGICQTCHTATEHHQNDGTAPSGQNHNDATVCTTCHTHAGTAAADDGFRDHEGTVTLPGSHNGQACDTCHDSGTYVTGAAIDNAKCLGCHDGVTATQVETHHTPADLNCTDCHNPMNAQGSNLSHIKTSLAVFTANATGADFANGTGSGICETCHTTTTYYNNTGTGAPHFTDACTGCHTHEAGFQPVGGTPPFPHDTQDCTTCHTGASFSDPITDAACLSCHDESAPGSGGGGGSDFSQLDEFTGVTHETKVVDNPGFTNWVAVPGSDGKNAWCYGDIATDSSGTGSNPGNPVPFVFIESSAAGTSTCGDAIALGSSQYLESNVLDASAYAFDMVSFDYNMEIGGDGSLHLDAWNGTGWDLDVTGGAIASGTQGASWSTAGPYDLSSYTNADFMLRIRFVVSSSGNVYENDLLLDNLAVDGLSRGGGGIVSGLGSWSTNFSTGTGAANLTYSVPAGSDRVLVVVVSAEDSGQVNITGATYGGQALILIDEATQGSGYSNETWAGYCDESCIAGASGTTIAATFSGSHSEGMTIGAATYEGVDQTSPIADFNSLNTTSNSISVNANNPEGGMVFYGVEFNGVGGNSISPPSGFTEMAEFDTTGNGYRAEIGEHNSTTAATVTVNPTNTGTSSNRTTIVAAALNPATGGGGGTGSDLKVRTHGDSVNAPRPYAYSNTCVDCHNPMSTQPNLAFIRPTISGSVLGGVIDFTQYTGTGSFADGPPYTDNICDTCHSQTQHHQADGSSPGGQSHNDGTDCAGCHPHLEGFQPQGGCVGCHSTQQGAGRRDVVNGDFTAASHHIQALPDNIDDASCIQCHGDLITDQNHPVGATADQITELQDPDTGTYIAFDGAGAPTPELTTFCVNCHDTDGVSRTGGNGTMPFTDSGDNTTPPNIKSEWNLTYGHRAAGVECMECHGDSAGDGTTLAPFVNAHGSDTAPHLQYSYDPNNQLGFCENCHGGGGIWGLDVSLEFNTGNNSRHPIGSPLNDQLDTEQLTGGWNPGDTMTCSDCHDTASGSAGPHGSSIKWMLTGTNKAWPYTSASSNGSTGTSGFRTLNSYNNSSGSDNGLFCLNCHVVTNGGGGWGGSWGSGQHIHEEDRDHESIPCVGCHIRVPHGGIVSRLIAAGNTSNPLTVVPSRLAPNANGGGTGYVRKFSQASSANNYNKSNCYSTNGSCSDHNSSGNGNESW